MLSGYSRLSDIGGKDEEQTDLLAQSHAAFLTTTPWPDRAVGALK